MKNASMKDIPLLMKWREALMIQTVFCMKIGIANDIQIGLVPPTVKCFADLHNYVDANEYGGFCVDEYAGLLTELFGTDERGGMSQDNIDFINEAQGAIDTWMRGANAPEQVTPKLVLVS